MTLFPHMVYLWDLPLRLFHWLLVISLIVAYMTGKYGGLWLDWHARIGVFILALIVFRIIWGFMGSTYSRFSSFVPTPGRLKRYFCYRRQSVGHNPLGALSIFAMLGVILAQAGTGLFSVNDEIDIHGPLYDMVDSTWSARLAGWHVELISAVQFLTALHVIAIGYYSGFKHKNLIRPMITGRLKLAAGVTTVEPVRGGGRLSLLVAVAMAAMVFWSIESGALPQWLSAAITLVYQAPIPPHPN